MHCDSTFVITDCLLQEPAGHGKVDMEVAISSDALLVRTGMSRGSDFLLFSIWIFLSSRSRFRANFCTSKLSVLSGNIRTSSNILDPDQFASSKHSFQILTMPDFSKASP
jgi:hypothetical protein